jgi:uncharacterized paraquat-inducible protein A
MTGVTLINSDFMFGTEFRRCPNCGHLIPIPRPYNTVIVNCPKCETPLIGEPN